MRLSELYIQHLNENQKGTNWIDENLNKKIEKLNGDKAFERPIPEIHSVAELVSHIIVWRYAAIERLKGKQPNLTMSSPENWKGNIELQQIGWHQLKVELSNTQSALIKFIENKPDKFFLENEYVKGYSYKYLIEGLIQHDIYHLGQIGITIKLLTSK